MSGFVGVGFKKMPWLCRNTLIHEIKAKFNVSIGKGTAFSTSAKCNMDISGVYPPITTPFNSDETIAFDKLQSNIDKWNKIPFRGYVVLGSNGESVYLTSKEQVEMVRQVAQVAGKDKLIIAGAGRDATHETIQVCKDMSAAGANAVLVYTPFYYKGLMTNDVLVNHFTKVADASPVPVILYNVPGNTGLDMAAEVVIQLSKHPNIVGIKESGGDISKIGYMVYKTQGNNFQVLAGSASFLLSSFTVGCVGGVCAVANVLGEACCELESLFKQGKMEEAKVLQHRLIYPNIAVTKRFGVPGLKTSMAWKGYYGGQPRSPLLPLSQENTAVMRKIFSENGFL